MTCIVIAVQIGHDHGFRQTFHAELILWIETAYAFHRITEKFDPERLIAAVAEHVDDAATDAELPGFVNEFHARELHLDQPFLQRIDRKFFVAFDGERVLLQLFAANHHRHQRLGIRYDRHAPIHRSIVHLLPLHQHLQHFGALHALAIVMSFGIVRRTRRRRIEQARIQPPLVRGRSVLCGKCFEIVKEIGGLFAIVQHMYMNAFDLFADSGRDHGA